ncbi:hypothetical protein [Candidatus Tisiphia endosymbiont of Hybos culiciformis]|uniref:phosphatase domain-containing protein n=1 Tax=Candidatus Tisiphia endosymbiont of Hybos culiciformis TaxID=3139331 RepID=UPI003CCAC180
MKKIIGLDISEKAQFMTVLGIIVLLLLMSCTNRSSCITYMLPPEYLNNGNLAYFGFNNHNKLSEFLPKHIRYINQYNIIGSGQFSVNQFKNAIVSKVDIIDVDLRSEYHGFNGLNPVSFISLPYNDSNTNRFQEEIIVQEQYLFNSILPTYKQLSIYINNLKVKPTKNDPTACITIATRTEDDMMKSLNIDYHRITVLDHREPSNDNLDKMVALFDQKLKLSPSRWVYVHCNGGNGRTTTAIAELIMLKQQEADKLQPFDDLISYVESVNNGYKLVPNCNPRDKNHRCQWKWHRYNTLKIFYNFVRTRANNQTFSNWYDKNV